MTRRGKHAGCNECTMRARLPTDATMTADHDRRFEIMSKLIAPAVYGWLMRSQWIQHFSPLKGFYRFKSCVHAMRPNKDAVFLRSDSYKYEAFRAGLEDHGHHEWVEAMDAVLVALTMAPSPRLPIPKKHMRIRPR